MWTAAAALLLLPALAMQLTPEVYWDETDFIVMGALLVAVCGAVEWAVRTSGNWVYRSGVAVAAASAFLLVWINLAVRIIGSEDNPANLMFGGVLAVALAGTVLARLRAGRMVLVLVATAVAQAIVGSVAVAQASSSGLIPQPEVPILTVFFTLLWLISAWLFRRAAQQVPAG